MTKFESYFIENIIPIILIGNMFLFISWMIDGLAYTPLMVSHILAVFYCGYKFLNRGNNV
jgi:hypothetical protein